MTTIVDGAPEVVTSDPYNAQTPRTALRHSHTPVDLCFVRDHFAVPRLEARSWRLRLGPGPAEIGYDQLLSGPRAGVDVVLECAGNGRSGMWPRPPGLAWGERAVACVRFEGVPLRSVAPPEWAGACEIVFTGADSGVVDGGRARFERSLPLEVALHPDTLLATHMNGAPLPPAHGWPVRLVVPGWYGVASVKWLVEARAVAVPFTGPFQTQYVYRRSVGSGPSEPVTTIRVKSVVTDPAPGAEVTVGRMIRIAGWAWSAAPVVGVEVSANAGRTWVPARLGTPQGHGWTRWRLRWTPAEPGRYVLSARARDATGACQPSTVPWNALGYGNNATSMIEVIAR